jgi:hypothetical protein
MSYFPLQITRLFSEKTLDTLCKVLTAYDLWTIYEVAHVQLNKSMYLPYHNTYHALSMVLDCNKGASYAGLDFNTTRQLLIAALCHDINHSGGKESDDKNIMYACEAVKELQRLNYLSQEDCEVVIDIIKVTQYPYTDLPLDTESKRIIRDADLCAMLGDAWLEHIVVGLQQELAVANIVIPRNILKESYWKFYSEAPKHSLWGKDLYDSHMYVIQNRLTALEALLLI